MNSSNNIILETNFTTYDFFIVIFYLLVTLIVGLYAKNKIKIIDDFIVAGRKIGTGLGIASMAGTEMGLITIMYSAQKGFVGGFAAFHIALIAFFVTLFVGISGFIIYPLRKTNVMTIPEYYEIRYGKNVRILGAIILSIGGILNMGLFLKVGSMFIVGILGFSPSGLMLPIIMTTLLVLALIYTILGGMFSVIITDYIQFVLMSFVILFTTYFSIQYLGWQNIWDTVYIEMGERGFNPLLDGEFGIEYIIWMIITAGLVSCAIWPTAIARALAMKKAEDVKTQYKWSSITFLIRFLIPYFWGICAFVYFNNNIELGNLFFKEVSGEKLNNLYALPIYLSKVIPVGFIGLLTAGMIAAFMSTHDSYLLCWSSVITQDIISPLRKKELSDLNRIKIVRIIIVIIGLYVLYWGLIYNGSEDVWDYMAITGSIYFSGAISVLIGGLYWDKASQVGAILSLLGGLFAIFGLGPVQDSLNISISGTRIGLLTIILSIVLLILGSLLFPDKNLKRTKNEC